MKLRYKYSAENTHFLRNEVPLRVIALLQCGSEVKWSELKSLSPVQLFVTPWIVAHQAPLSMRFSRQEYWSGLPFPSPGDLPNPGIEPGSPTLEADALTSEPPGGSKHIKMYFYIFRIYATYCYSYGFITKG